MIREAPDRDAILRPVPEPSARRSPSARVLAVRVLRDVARHQGFSNRWLSHHLERAPTMDPRDRGLATTLVYGVLRHRTRLDAHIDAHAKRAAGLRGEVREVLRVAAFEQLELERPPAIAITEALHALAVLDRSGRLGGAAQAILSAIDRTGKDIDQTLEHAPPLDALERRWSIPRWLAGRWLARHGPERARRRARALAEPPPVDLRIDLSRTNLDTIRQRLAAEHPGARVHTVPGDPRALRVHGGGDLFYGALHGEGLVSVQGLAAQQAAVLLAPEPGELVLDACAGMGVKTLQLAELMQRRGRIVAVDRDPEALEALDDLAQRGRLTGSALTLEHFAADLREPDPRLDAALFDRILLDVPCSATGVIRRHADIKLLRRAEDIPALAQRQRQLLTQAWSMLRPGGQLLYASCSVLKDETAAVVGEFLNATPTASDVTEDRWQALGQALGGVVSAGPGRAIATGTAGMDGFYYACLEKQER